MRYIPLSTIKAPLQPVIVRYIGETMVGLARRTVEEHQLTFKTLLKFLDGRSISRETGRAWVNSLLITHKSSTIIKQVTHIRRLCLWAVNEKLIEESPLTGLRLPPHTRETPVPFDEKSYQRLLELNRGTDFEWLFLLGYASGMSIGDCCLLKRSEIDLEHGLIRIDRQKSGVPSRIPIDPEIEFGRQLVQRMELPYRRGWAGNWKKCDFFNDELARRYLCDRTELFRLLKVAYRKAGVPETMSFRNFRNRFCSIVINSGCSPKAAMQATGHKSIAQLMQYVTVPDDVVRDQVLAAFRKNQEKQG